MRTFIAITLMFVILVAFMYFRPVNDGATNNSNVAQQVSTSVGSATDNASNQDAATAALGAQADASSQLPAEETINDEWSSSRGYDEIDLNWYQLDEEYVESLAAAGDMSAQQVQAWRTMASDPATSMNWLREAAIGGSTNALMGMAERSWLIAQEKLTNPWPEKSDLADFRSLALAYPLAAQIRGDYYTGPYVADEAVRILNLSEGEVASACIKAKQIYNELLSERVNRGFDEFDDSPPPLIAHGPNYTNYCSD